MSTVHELYYIGIYVGNPQSLLIHILVLYCDPNRGGAREMTL